MNEVLSVCLFRYFDCLVVCLFDVGVCVRGFVVMCECVVERVCVHVLASLNKRLAMCA